MDVFLDEIDKETVKFISIAVRAKDMRLVRFEEYIILSTCSLNQLVCFTQYDRETCSISPEYRDTIDLQLEF